MTKLTTNRNYKAFAGVVFAFLVCAGSFVPTPVYAEFGAAETWALVNAGFISSPTVTAFKNSVVEQYTSLSPGELTMLEYELGAIYTVGSVVLAQDWCLEHGVTFDGLSGSYTVTGLSKFHGDNNVDSVCVSSCLSSPSGFIFNSDVGSFGILPVVPNGGYFTPSYSTFTNYDDPWFFIIDVWTDPHVIYQLSLDASGLFDFHTGVGSFATYYNPQTEFAIRGGVRTSWEHIAYLPSFSDSWYNPQSNVNQFVITGNKDIMNYTAGLALTDIDTPSDLYNYAYNKALEDYPEYIENWVDLEDEFSGSEPGAFDSLEFPPYIPNVDFHDVEVPTETLPTGLTDGAGFWFSAFSNMVDAFNLKPYVILFLCIMLVMVILKI